MPEDTLSSRGRGELTKAAAEMPSAVVPAYSLACSTKGVGADGLTALCHVLTYIKSRFDEPE
jgi:hypothetical protein